VLTVARALGDAALHSGLEVAVGQLHGMAQRGGSVEASVVIGTGVESSFVEQADVVLGFEPLEVLRALPRLTETTHVVFNHGRVVPFPLSMQGLSYPDVGGILDRIRAVTTRVTEVDGPELLARLGDTRPLNMLMLGVLARRGGALPFDARMVRSSLERLGGSQRRLALNLRAFDLGQKQPSR
jgi:indolepyruvate ferredoxin oxidoreductase beta subunit